MKAILVIDIDEDMFDTIDQERIKSGNAFVDVSHHYVEEWDDWVFHRVKLLSAKPMPVKNIWDKKDFADGWNACLERLEK